MILPVGYESKSYAPPVDDYLRLRRVAGLSAFSELAAENGLKGTYFGVSIIHEGQIVGMGRIVGDGGLFFQIVDIAVDPTHQGRGLGKAIMTILMGHLKAYLTESAYISLMADIPANTLYEKFGFKESAPQTIGMAQVLQPE